MANMSYCRFENTYRDLADCEQAMNDGETNDLEGDEEKYRKRLIRLCVEIAKEYGPDAVSNALYGLTLKELEVH